MQVGQGLWLASVGDACISLLQGLCHAALCCRSVAVVCLAASVLARQTWPAADVVHRPGSSKCAPVLWQQGRQQHDGTSACQACSARGTTHSCPCGLKQRFLLRPHHIKGCSWHAGSSCMLAACAPMQTRLPAACFTGTTRMSSLPQAARTQPSWTSAAAGSATTQRGILLAGWQVGAGALQLAQGRCSWPASTARDLHPTKHHALNNITI